MLYLIANPAAGGGRGGRLLPEARRLFEAAGARAVLVTAAAGDEARLAREALERGGTTLAVLGGDGTFGKVIAAVAAAGAGARCRVALAAAGTGNDLLKTVGVRGDLASAVRAAAGDRWRPHDLLRAGPLLAANSIGAGFDAAVLARARRMRWPRGPLVYPVAALGALLGYAGFDAAVDGAPPRRRLMIVVANGAHFGGVFCIAPGARADDGLLDLVEIGEVRGALARLGLFARAARGTHLGHRAVAARRTARVSLHFTEPPWLDVDGDLVRAASASVTVECVPAAVRIAVP